MHGSETFVPGKSFMLLATWWLPQLKKGFSKSHGPDVTKLAHGPICNLAQPIGSKVVPAPFFKRAAWLQLSFKKKIFSSPLLFKSQDFLAFSSLKRGEGAQTTYVQYLSKFLGL